MGVQHRQSDAALLALWREGRISTEQLTVAERNRLMVRLIEEALIDEAAKKTKTATRATTAA